MNLFLKILFRAYKVFIFVQTFHWILSDFIFNFRFSRRKSQSQQNRSLILQYSYAQETSLILRTSTHLTLKIICSRNTAKSLSDLINFQQTRFCLVSEKIFVLHPLLTPKNYILEAFERKCLYISIYLLKKSFVPET